MSILLSTFALLPLKMFMETWESPMTLWICHLHYFVSHILVRMCTCISTCSVLCLTPNVCFTSLAYLHGKMGSSVWHCVHVLQSLYFWSHTLFTHGCMHQYINLCPNLTLHVCSITIWRHFMKTWLTPVWHCVFVTISLFLSHTPLLEYVHVSVHRWFMFIWLFPFQFDAHVCIVIWKDSVPLCSTVCVFQSTVFMGIQHWLECVHESVHVFMSIWFSSITSNPLCHSYIETRVASMWQCVFLSHSPHICVSYNFGMECVHASVHVFMSNLSSEFCSIPYA